MELIEQFDQNYCDTTRGHSGDMWRVITRANLSHIVDKLVNVLQGL